MEHTRENIIKSLRACSSPSESACTRCLYGDFEEGCRDQLRLAAADMLEEIGKGELLRKSEEVKAELVKIIAEVGATQPSEMGKVMGVATKRLAGLAEGRLISTLVKQLLA